MASVSKDKKGNRIVQFVGADGKRRSVWMGKERMRTVNTVKAHVEELAAAQKAGRAPYDDTSRWVARIGKQLHRKLDRVGLVAPREPVKRAEQVTLAAFLDRYVAERDDVKDSTATVYGHTRRCLVGYFGGGKPLDDVTPGDADDWRRWLTRPKNEKAPDQGGQGLSENTARRRCGIARQFFRAAVRRRLIATNPFDEMKGLAVQANRSRDYFVTREEADKVFAACPDVEWQLIFALGRYGGLRTPSETLVLRWGDVNWKRGTLVVRSPKTAHHEDKASRVVPIFGPLRPYLQAAYDELLADFDPKERPLSKEPVIRRYRDSNSNLRTQLRRIIEVAGLKPWPKLFQNLRATRATELVNMRGVGPKAASEWMGHSQKIADKHYWQVTDDDYKAALAEPAGPMQNPMQSASATAGKASYALPTLSEESTCMGVHVGDTGLEPVTSTL